ncbi:MAG: hypothetical protein ACYC0V_14670, partial [Armatimonadota bacterium]
MNVPDEQKPNEVDRFSVPTTGSHGREEEARLWLENTMFSARTAWILVICLLFTILFVPVIQLIYEAKRSEQASAGGRFPSFNILRLIPGLREVTNTDSSLSSNALLPSVKDIKAYEDTLEEQSVVANWIL